MTTPRKSKSRKAASSSKKMKTSPSTKKKVAPLTKTPKTSRSAISQSHSPRVAVVAKVFKLSLSIKDWEVLDSFFQRKGLRVATGIKMILRDFIEKGLPD